MTTSLKEIEKTDTGVDIWGIRKLYPDSEKDFQEWYMREARPKEDPQFQNWKNANVKKQPDGSFRVDGMGGTGKGQVRVEGRCASRTKKWLNGEVTVYAKYLEDLTNSSTAPGSYSYQVYLRGANHSTSMPCLGSCYKVRIRKNKSVAIVKEVQHPEYSSNRPGTRKIAKEVRGNYLGVKEVVYNFQENGKTFVKVELWIDENGMDANGVLDTAKQNWVKMAETVDRGGWKAMDSASTCPSVNVDSTTKDKRQPDEIISLPGGTADWNCAAFRTDGVAAQIKHFSVREIQPPGTGGQTQTPSPSPSPPIHISDSLKAWIEEALYNASETTGTYQCRLCEAPVTGREQMVPHARDYHNVGKQPPPSSQQP
jgi:hypothetical protein